MDTHLSSVGRKRVSKKSKPKRNPVRVVYISNPMKVKASAAEFRALVQELTGQDAELPPVPTRFSDRSAGEHGGGSDHGGSSLIASGDLIFENREQEVEVEEVREVVELSGEDQQQGAEGSSYERVAELEDVYTPEMIENLSSGFFPASGFYESAQMDHVLRSLGTM